MTILFVLKQKKSLILYLSLVVILTLVVISGWKVYAQTSNDPDTPNPSVESNTSPSLNMFLSLDGIPGESTDKQHPNAVVVNGFNFGENVLTPSTNVPTGKTQFSSFTFTKTVDKSSPKLFEYAATGKHIKTATLSVRKAGSDQDYYVVTLSDVVVSSIHTDGSSAKLTETVSLNFSKIQIDYQTTNNEGSLGEPVLFNWNTKLNRAD